MDTNIGTVPLEVQQLWANQHLPFIYFDYAEKFFPSSVDRFFERDCVHKTSTSIKQDCNLEDMPALHLELADNGQKPIHVLSRLAHELFEKKCISDELIVNSVPQGCIYNAKKPDPFFYGDKPDKLGQIHSPYYYYFEQITNNTGVIGASGFYPLSGPIPLFVDDPLPSVVKFIVCEIEDKKASCTVAVHTGDWDGGIQIYGHFNQTTFTPEIYNYKAHGQRYATTLNPELADYTIDEHGYKHPNLYVGCFTHPSFPFVINGATVSLDKNGGAGPTWKTWETPINFMNITQPIPGKDWHLYTFGYDMHSPSGPPASLDWLKP